SLPGALRAALGELHGANILVEMVLPPYLFDTPVDRWELFRRAYQEADPSAGQAPGYIRLGYRYPVVIRDLERFQAAESRNHARARWALLRDGDGDISLHWMSCHERRNEDALYRWFEWAQECAAIGIPGPAGREPGWSA